MISLRSVGAGSLHPPQKWGHSSQSRVTNWGGAVLIFQLEAACVARTTRPYPHEQV